MKHFNITLLLTILLWLGGAKSFAYDACIDGIYYDFFGDIAIVTYKNTYYNSYSGKIVIPESINYWGKTYIVTSIGNAAFRNCTMLTSITIPESVTEIGTSAFNNCSGLASISIPESVTNIGSSTFSGCSGLNSITIPEGLTGIGDGAFYGCSGLTSITIPKSVTNIGSSAFSGCNGLTSITIPESMTTIGGNAFYETAWYKKQPDGLVYAGNVAYKYKGTMNYNTRIELKEGTLGIAGSAFADCSRLTSIIIPEGVTSIGNQAFSGCSGLDSITIPEGLTSIGDGIFYGCSGLIYITIPESVTSIGKQAFEGCIGLTSITIPESVSSIGDQAFCDCIGLTSITIPEGVTSINSDAFYGTAWYNNQPDGLVYVGKIAYRFKSKMPENTSIELKDDTKGIAGSAFWGCSGLTSITIPESVTSIGKQAFYGCTGLTSITIPERVTSIGIAAFQNCSGLTSITIPESVTSISGSTFERCSNLTSINIPESVTSIDDAAFDGCSSLTSIFIPESVTTIGRFTFWDCGSLTSINIPEGVTSIGDQAFDGCSSLTSITIPESVKSIGNSAFRNCSSLTSIIINLPTVGSWFSGLHSIKEVQLGKKVTTIGDSAFYGSTLSSLIVGSGVLSISPSAFSSTPKKTIWLTNTPPEGYKTAEGVVNYAANNQYVSLANTTIYPFLSSMFEVEGIRYVPISPSERTCDAIDCLYHSSATNIKIGKTVNYKGIQMSVNEVKPYTGYQQPYMEVLTATNDGNIGEGAFYGCSSLKEVTVSISGEIGSETFANCSSLQTVALGDSITSIGDSVFSNCSSLQEVKIPDEVQTLGSSAFLNCTSLTSIDIGNGICTIPSSVFSGCSSLQKIVLPQSVVSIGDYVFQGCKSLKAIVMEEQSDDAASSELSLGSNGSSPLFADCPLDSVFIGRNITYSTASGEGYSPFYRNTSLRAVTITDKETEISPNEFYGCTNLKNVRIGDGVERIGDWAFSGCSSLEYFAFGARVKNIGTEAFSDCNSVTQIISRAITPPACGAQALDDINKWNCKLIVPQGKLKDYQAADQWKDFFFAEEVDMGFTHKLTYTVDGEEYKTCDYEFGMSIVPEETPAKEGYTFSGWSGLPLTMPNQDVIVTGSFTINQYMVKFIVDGEVISEQKLDFGSDIMVPETPAKEGYTFSGWSDIPETVPAIDVVIYGSFAVNKYIIIYMIDGEEYKKVSVDYGTPLTAEEAPKKEGYTFSGWNDVPTTMPAHDVTVTGSFTVNTYMVRYYVGDQLIAEDEVEYGAEVVLRDYTSDDASRYSFAGWEGEVYATMPAHDIEYHAIIVDFIVDMSGTSNHVQAIYDTNGRKLNQPQRGVNILLMRDGSKRKLVVK